MDALTVAYALIAVGVVLMAAELLLPTHGMLLALGIGVGIIGVALTFRYDLGTGVITLLVLMVALPIFGGWLLRLWYNTPLGKRMFLPGPNQDDAVAAMPVNLELERLRGRYGRTLSALRPCGLVDFDGKRVDTMTHGEMIEANHWVRCVDIKGGHVIVRQVPPPPDLGGSDSGLFS